VVYDRKRENLRLYRKRPLRPLIDLSITETMSRTIGTSPAIFLATPPLALCAGGALRESTLVLLLGVVLATSCFTFIPASILLYLSVNRLRRNPVEEPGAASAPTGGDPLPSTPTRTHEA